MHAARADQRLLYARQPLILGWKHALHSLLLHAHTAFLASLLQLPLAENANEWRGVAWKTKSRVMLLGGSEESFENLNFEAELWFIFVAIASGKRP